MAGRDLDWDLRAGVREYLGGVPFAGKRVLEIGPAVIKAFIGVLGFEDSEVRYHIQTAGGRRERLFTVIGRRTHGGLEVDPHRKRS